MHSIKNELLELIKVKLRLTYKIEFCRIKNNIHNFSIIGDYIPKQHDLKFVISKYKKINNYFNFNLNSLLITDFLRKYNPVRLKNYKEKLLCTDTSSFNPTGIPHIGNLQVLIHGLCIKRIQEVILNVNIDSIYFVNDVGGQVGKILEALKTGKTLEGYDIKNINKSQDE